MLSSERGDTGRHSGRSNQKEQLDTERSQSKRKGASGREYGGVNVNPRRVLAQRGLGWLGVLVVIALTVGALATPAHADGTVTDHYLWVDDLGTMKQVRVYLPEGYVADDAETRYPVAYFLHGGSTVPASYGMLIDALDATTESMPPIHSAARSTAS